MLRRMFIASALAIGGLGLAAPTGASAATTLGETFAPALDSSCNGGPDSEAVQIHRASGPSYAAPSAGVLTSWSFQSSNTQSTTLTLRVFHPTGTPQEFTPIADGGPQQTIAASSGVHTFPVTIPVETGDLIGIRGTDGACASSTLSTGDVYDSHFGPAHDIGTPAIYSEGFERIFDIAASLEPDCDKDGLGDETQDPNPSVVCPTVTPGGPTGSNGSNGQTTTKKCKKKKHKRSAESAKKHKKKGCKKKKKKRH
jgi:hypothetical protein